VSERLILALADALDPPEHPLINNPIKWVSSELHEATWSGQRLILEAVRDHRYTAVVSCHSAGKSHIASRVMAWWAGVHPLSDTFIVSTAPSTTQVRAILWRYVRVAQRKAGLPGYITVGDPVEWKLADGTLIGYGRKPQDLKNAEEAATAFQGIHAKYVLIIIDEAGGVPEWLWTAVDTLVTSPTNRVLAIGNPDDPTSHFEKVARPGSQWHKIFIPASATPAFTDEPVAKHLRDALVSREWVEERKKDWGEDSPLYISKVLARFPEVTEETLIRPSWVREAQERDLSGLSVGEPGTFGLDVARHGKAETVCYRNRAGMIREEWHSSKQDTMKTAGRAAQSLNETFGAAVMHIDTIGVGGGVYDRLNEQGFPVVEFIASAKPTTREAQRRFANLRAEQWWAFRCALEAGEYDLPPDGEDDKMISQLLSMRYKIRSDGRIVIESKEDMEKRGLPSPDRADAVMQSTVVGGEFWLPPARRADSRGVDEGSLTADLLEKRM
jgi:hypothetical protein